MKWRSLAIEEPQGPPNLQLGGLKIWAHQRQFPGSHDLYDGNWLMITARCEAPGTLIQTAGPLLMTTDIDSFMNACMRLHESMDGGAALQPLEPELDVQLHTTDSAGHIEARVRLTPDHLTQTHDVRFEIDQSHLPRIIRDCRRVLVKFPVRKG